MSGSDETKECGWEKTTSGGGRPLKRKWSMAPPADGGSSPSPGTPTDNSTFALTDNGIVYGWGTFTVGLFKNRYSG